MSDLQQHLDADVAALNAGIELLEQEIATLKVSPGAIGTGLDFTGLDNVVATLKQATAGISPAPAATGTEPAGDAGSGSGAPAETGSGEASSGAPPAGGADSSASTGSAADAGTSGSAQEGSGAPADAGAAPAPTQTLYEFTGTGTPDPTSWTLTALESTDGKALYTFAGDTAPGDTKGASADWAVYSGPTQPAASGS